MCVLDTGTALYGPSASLAVVMAMHDLNLASRFSDTMIFLYGGRIYDAGAPGTVLTSGNIRSVYGVEAEVVYRCGG